jgi:hypothetical protein
MCNTPGFPLTIVPKLVRDLQGFDRLELPRNNRRIVASSRWLLQGWRANSDIQPLLYTGDSFYPSPEEIARVTDYIVAYCCKGNEHIVEEMKQMKALILGCQDVTGNTNDVKRVARKLLNITTKNKVISKQECMCHLAKLNLYLCSESFETVSISGEYRLCTSVESKYSFLSKYAKQDIEEFGEMSLHQYFHHIKNPKWSKSQDKCIIPHYVGASSVPTYPPSEGYAKSVLILHVPWKKTFNEQGESRNYIDEFKLFLDSSKCPMSVSVGYERAKARVQQNKQFVEPTGKNETTNYESFTTTVDDGIEEIVALAGTLGLTCAPDSWEENEYFYGDDSTDWSQQYCKV